MASKNEAFLNEIPYGDYCHTISQKGKVCPYYVFLDNGLTKCTLINITSEDDEFFENKLKICGFNELDKEVKGDIK